MRFLIIVSAIALIGASNSVSQVRPAEESQDDQSPSVSASTQSRPIKAKYESGMFGFSKKESGTLEFDDVNERLAFYGKDRRERFSIPYSAILVVQPHSQSATSTTGNVVRHIPLPGASLGGLIREKRRFLILQFSDQDVDVRGTVSFKLDNKEQLDAAITILGRKAKMTQRGDAYYRPKGSI